MHPPTPLRRLTARRPVASIARETLRAMAGGQLSELPISLRFWDGSVLPARPAGEPSDDGARAPMVTARRPRALSHLLYEAGELGLARGYVDGSLVADDDLEDLLAMRTRMRSVVLSGRDRARLAVAAVRAGGPAILRRPAVPAIEASLSGDRHSLGRDRRAVRHHYDVSNDFYRLVLGPSMVYSCAYFSDPGDTLEEAQERKLDLICRKLDLQPGERLLDIGCGWGSLMLHAVANYGVRATGVTLSGPQAALARERAAQQGLADRVEIRAADYRELDGRQFDKIASVGMYEHVGRSELVEYVRTAHDLLAPGGLMLNHGIVRLDARPPDPKTFIARYIFPDGELHPVADLIGALQSTGLEVRDVESLREHYPLTLRNWVANLRARHDEAVAIVGPERTRTWDLYMVGSAQAFEAAEIGVYQVLATRLDGAHRLPLDRLTLLEPDRAAVPAS